MQNEPTADDDDASADSAEGCDARGAKSAPPDPHEMAALRQFTERLSRVRPAEHRDDPDAELPDGFLT